MNPTKIVFASSRRRGNTGQLADLIAEKLSVELVDLGSKNISEFDYAHLNRADDFEPLMASLLDCENLIFASPIYWYSVAPRMKIFLDRISDYLDVPDLLAEGRRLRGKTGYIVCTSNNSIASDVFINAFTATFDYLGMNFGGYLHADCRNGFVKVEHDKTIEGFIELLLA